MLCGRHYLPDSLVQKTHLPGEHAPFHNHSYGHSSIRRHDHIRIMTEGIEIAIIGAVGLVLAPFVPLLFRKRAVKNPMQKIAVGEARPKSPQTIQKFTERDAPVPRRVTDLSHKEISDDITRSAWLNSGR